MYRRVRLATIIDLNQINQAGDGNEQPTRQQ